MQGNLLGESKGVGCFFIYLYYAGEAAVFVDVFFY